MKPLILDPRAVVFHGDSRDIRKALPPNSVHAMITDPPAGIGFMGKAWDLDKGGPDQWSEWLAEIMRGALEVLKPGGHALVWAIPRTSHWTARALEIAGFEIRDVVHDVFDSDTLAQAFVDGLDPEQRAGFLRLLDSQASPIMMQIFGCVPLETEILTERGWITHDQIAEGDRAVQVDARGRASLGTIQAVSVYPFDGEMCQIKTRSTLQLLTPGHKVHAYAERGRNAGNAFDAELTSRDAFDFTEHDSPGVCAWHLPLGARGAEIRHRLESVDTAELCGWVIAEGHFHTDVAAVSIYQNEGAFADRIRGLLARLRIEHSEYRRTRDNYDGTPRDSVQWYIGTREPAAAFLRTELAGKKPTPSERLAWLPEDQALALFDALVSGDGSRNHGGTSGAWYQKRPEVRAWFQTLCFRLGYRSQEDLRGDAIAWSKRDTTQVSRGCHRERWASRVPFVGQVWCPTVPEGRWVARYQGHVFVTGNTGFPKSMDVSKQLDKLRDDSAEVRVVCRFLRSTMEARGVTSVQLGAAFGMHSRMIDHWAARDTDSQPTLPTDAQWSRLEELLGFADPAARAEVARLNARKGEHGEAWKEAEVIGTKVMADTSKVCAGFTGAAFNAPGDVGARRLVDLKAPNSEPAQRWKGWGTALKPAVEHWILCRKPLDGTVARNVLAHGTGGINVDATRIGDEIRTNAAAANKPGGASLNMSAVGMPQDAAPRECVGRWPAHLTLDEHAAAILDEQSGTLKSGAKAPSEPNGLNQVYGEGMGGAAGSVASKGGASRFFYCAKAPRNEKDAGLEHLEPKTGGAATDREEGSAGLSNPRTGAGRTGGARNHHPTVKNLALMRWLVRLITPPGGIVLDLFAGSGSTLVAALEEGFGAIGVELTDEYLPILEGRVRHALRNTAAGQRVEEP